nr:hypothetical protein [Helicobacter valdiviensis]
MQFEILCFNTKKHKRNISINYFFYGSSIKEILDCEEKYKILKLYKTNASLGGGGINEFVEFQEIIIDNTLLDFLKVKIVNLLQVWVIAWKKL